MSQPINALCPSGTGSPQSAIAILSVCPMDDSTLEILLLSMPCLFMFLFLRLLYAESVFVNALHVLLIPWLPVPGCAQAFRPGLRTAQWTGWLCWQTERFLHGAAPNLVNAPFSIPAPVVSTTLAFLAGTVSISRWKACGYALNR